MSREFRGLAFRAGRNDTPFLYAQRMQEQGIRNQQLQNKRMQEKAEADQKWVQEMRNTDYKNINTTVDNYIQKESRKIFDGITQAIKESPEGVLPQERKEQLEKAKFDLKGDYNFVKSATEEYKAVLDSISGTNKKYYNMDKAASAMKDMYEKEIFTPEGKVNRSFDVSKIQEKANSYENLNTLSIIDDALSGLSETISKEVDLSGGVKKETELKYNSYTKTTKDANGNTKFVRDDNGMIEVEATPELVADLSRNSLMNTVIEGKRAEIAEERGTPVTKKEALEVILKERNSTTVKENIYKDPTVTSDKGKDSFDLSVNTADDTVFTNSEAAMSSGIAGYKAIYIDLPDKFTKSIPVETTDLDGKPVKGKFTFSQIGSDAQGREYIKIAQSQSFGEVSFKKIPFNEKNIKLIRNNLSKSDYLKDFNEAVNKVKSEFKNKKAIKVSSQDFQKVSTNFKNSIDSIFQEFDSEETQQEVQRRNSQELIRLLSNYGIDTEGLTIDRGSYFTGNSKRFYIEGGGIDKTKWTDNPEDMMDIAKMLYDANPGRFVSEFGSGSTQENQGTGESELDQEDLTPKQEPSTDETTIKSAKNMTYEERSKEL